MADAGRVVGNMGKRRERGRDRNGFAIGCRVRSTFGAAAPRRKRRSGVERARAAAGIKATAGTRVYFASPSGTREYECVRLHP